MPRVKCMDCPAQYHFGVNADETGEKFFSDIKICPTCGGKNRQQIPDIQEDIEW